MREKILGFIAYIFIKTLSLTLRYELEFNSLEDEKHFYDSVKRKNKKEFKQFLMAFFHQDELCLIPYFKSKHFGVLVSHSKDGQIMANAINRLGIKTTRGSSSRGAIAGLINSIKLVRSGYNFTLAVDGPRGPIYVVKEGICAIQNKTSVPIMPVRAYPQKCYIFEKSWNKAKLPYPFTTIKLKFGALNNNYETKTLQNVLNEL